MINTRIISVPKENGGGNVINNIVNNATTSNVNVDNGEFVTVNADSANITNLTSTTINATNVNATEGNYTNLTVDESFNASEVNADELNATNGTITTLSSTTATITTASGTTLNYQDANLQGNLNVGDTVTINGDLFGTYGEFSMVDATTIDTSNINVDGKGIFDKSKNGSLFKTVVQGDEIKLTKSSSQLNTTIAYNNISTPNVDTNNINSNDGNFDGEVYIENATIQDLLVTGSAHFYELIIDKIKATQGQLILTPANAKIIKVEQNNTSYKCYFQATDKEGNAIYNPFYTNDYVVCQNFNVSAGLSTNVSNKFYWYAISDVEDVNTETVTVNGADIDCWSITINTNGAKHSSTNGVPEAGDEIVQLGNSSVADRQSAIIISAYRNQYLDPTIIAPSIVQYNGINDFNLSNHRVNVMSKGLNTFKGNFTTSTGDDIEELIQNNSFVIKALYPTYNALIAAHPTGIQGEAYAVGTEASNVVYIWDVDTHSWKNIGALKGPQGAKGDKGDTGDKGDKGDKGAKGDDGDSITITSTSVKYAKSDVTQFQVYSNQQCTQRPRKNVGYTELFVKVNKQVEANEEFSFGNDSSKEETCLGVGGALDQYQEGCFINLYVDFNWDNDYQIDSHYIPIDIYSVQYYGDGNIKLDNDPIVNFGTPMQPSDSDFIYNSIPTLSKDDFLWSMTTVTYSDGTTTKTYGVTKNGVDGVNGENGAQGAKGDKGDKGDTGDKGDKGDTGDNAIEFVIDPAIEKAEIDSNGNLDVKFNYDVYRIEGNTVTRLSLSSTGYYLVVEADSSSVPTGVELQHKLYNSTYTKNDYITDYYNVPTNQRPNGFYVYLVYQNNDNYVEGVATRYVRVLYSPMASLQVKTTVNEQGQTIGQINATVAGHTSDISGLTNNVSQLQIQADGIESNVTSITNRVDYIDDEISDITTDLSTVKQTASGLTTSVTSLQNQVNAIPLDKTVTVDATSLSTSTYYPVSIKFNFSSCPSTLIRCKVHRTLANAYGVPSYSNHTNGFVVDLDWNCKAGGWGTNDISYDWSVNDKVRIINDYSINFVKSGEDIIVGSIRQNHMQSTEIVYVRGGSKYDISTSWSDSTITLHPNGYSWSSGSYSYSSPIKTASQIVVPVKDAMSKSQIEQTAKGITSTVTTQILNGDTNNLLYPACYNSDGMANENNQFFLTSILGSTDHCSAWGCQNLTKYGKPLINSSTSIEIGSSGEVYLYTPWIALTSGQMYSLTFGGNCSNTMVVELCRYSSQTNAIKANQTIAATTTIRTIPTDTFTYNSTIIKFTPTTTSNYYRIRFQLTSTTSATPILNLNCISLNQISVDKYDKCNTNSEFELHFTI